MNIIIALNLWGDVIVHMVWFFCRSYQQKRPKTVCISNLRLLIQEICFIILSLGLGLKNASQSIPAQRPKL